MTNPVAKVCIACGKDVAREKRVKDTAGNYYCSRCYEAMKQAQAAPTAAVPLKAATAPMKPMAPADSEGELDLAPVAAPPPRPPPRAVPSITPSTKPTAPSAGKSSFMSAMGTGMECPCCHQKTAAGAKICVGCGIRVPSGRPVITSLGRDEDSLYHNVEMIIRGLAWVLRLGWFPIASEAYASRKPIVIWVVAGLTILCSLVFYGAYHSNPESKRVNEMMLWTPDHWASDAEILAFYYSHSDDAIRQLVAQNPEAKDEFEKELVAKFREELQSQYQFHWYQLFTYALLHDPGSIFGFILHLGGNLLFLLIFGTRVNAMVGNLKMTFLYPLLAALSGGAHLLFGQHLVPSPMLGASGAIMGLAGMYLIFFPVHRVFMVAWLKIYWTTPAWIKIWSVRGFWVLLFYIAFDVIGTILRSSDGVAHWAHLGGFIAGAVLALIMLITRLQKTHGDLLSVMFGKAAWPLVGRPSPMVRGVVVG